MSEQVETVLRQRSGARCELCGATTSLRVQPVPAGGAATAERSVLACEECAGQMGGEALDEKHWFCLREAAWSEVPAVQVASLRLLKRLDVDWARELLGQVYVADELQAWVDEGAAGGVGAGGGAPGDGEGDAPTLDSNGTPLAEGDAVALIKDLDVKGGGFVAKRGTIVKNIRLTGDPENIEGKVNGTTLVLKTKFLKKA